MRDLPPIHPSEMLKEDFMLPFHLSTAELAQAIHISMEQLDSFLDKKQPLTVELALRLARYFSTDAQSWLNLQNHYDLELMQEVLSAKLETEIKPLATNHALHFA